MKHLKAFEKTNLLDNLKTYIVWKCPNDNEFIILKVLKNKPITTFTGVKCCSIENLYKYDIENKKVEKLEKDLDTEYSIEIASERILYQSDSLQDCFNILPTLAAQNKYNL